MRWLAAGAAAGRAVRGKPRRAVGPIRPSSRQALKAVGTALWCHVKQVRRSGRCVGCRKRLPAREVLDRTRREHLQANRPETSWQTAMQEGRCSSVCLRNRLRAEWKPFRGFFAGAWLFGHPGLLARSIRQAPWERNGRSRCDSRATRPSRLSVGGPSGRRSKSESTGLESESGTEGK